MTHNMQNKMRYVFLLQGKQFTWQVTDIF